MVTHTMGSQMGGSKSNTISRTQDPKLNNPLTREGSLYNLTLDEVQNHLMDLGKPLSSMNLDELLKTMWTVEANNQAMEGVDYEPASGLSLNRQSSLTLSRDLSKKTVDEVWKDIQQEQQRSNLDRKGTLGEMTLEDFLVKAGVVGGSVMGNYPNPSIHHPQQQHRMLPIFAPSHPVQQPIIMDAAYPDAQMAVSSSPLMGTLSDTQSPGRKRGVPNDIAEKSVERRQKRMIKNRESAARSRARKQAYTHELENKVSRLEEENERLKRLQELEKALPSVPPPEPRYQLRRTSSAPM